MTDRPLLIDEAWSKADPAAIKTAGYSGVIGYLSTDPSKNMTAARAAALHAHGLSVRVVWETTALRAGQGRLAGWKDRRAAEKQAAALGYPKGCPIFYAVDFDADPSKITPYFKGVRGGLYPVGVYGSQRVVEAVYKAGLAVYLWQTQAWSGTAVSPLAHLYQRVKPTLPHIAGATPGSYDENVLLRYTPAWVAAKPAPKPAAKPAVKPAKPAGKWAGWKWIWLFGHKGIFGYKGGTK